MSSRCLISPYISIYSIDYFDEGRPEEGGSGIPMYPKKKKSTQNL